MKLWWDLETYSETPINDGAHRYAENAEILLFAWAVDDGPVQCWDCSGGVSAIPSLLWEAIKAADEYWGHNSGGFDRTIMRHAMPHVFSEMTEQKHRDTMVQALCHGLPGSLGTLCDIFKLPADKAKDKRGKQLIRMFCMPQPANQKLRRKTRETHPQEWAEFIEYAKSDITSMRILHQKMPKWNYPNNLQELARWRETQRLNDEGIYVDLELSEKAIEAVNAAQTELSERVASSTQGAVGSATQRDKMLAYILESHGVSLPDMRADTIERRLDDPNLPKGVRELLAIRLMASTSSVSKYKRVMRCVSSDGYLRGGIQFCGAGRTGRDAHRLVQMGNMFRPTLEAGEIETGIGAIKVGCADLITDNVMELCANAIRGVIVAPSGCKIVVSDLSNIEGRVGAWVAGEEWKLQAFRDFDTIIGYDDKGKALRKGPDLYLVSYAKAFGVSIEEAERQIGKVIELMLQYQGGVGAFLTGAATYGINLDELAVTGRGAIPDHVWVEAENFWGWSKETGRTTYELSQETFQVCDSIKRLWRAANPKIAGIWKQLEDAARDAITNPEEHFFVNMICFQRVGNWLKVILPSGRYLSYPAPQVDDSGAISYLGLNRYSRKWQRVKTYGGMLLENLCQAISRDVLFYSTPGVERQGYSVRMRVHDEFITYVKDKPQYNAKHLASLIAAPHDWCKGLPLAAAGFEAYRYRKD